MNKCFFLMMTALMTAACNGESAPEGKPSQPGSAIAFTIDDGTTRASHRTAPNTLTLNGSGTNEQSLKTEGFGVFACHTGSHRYISSTITANLMWNQRVGYDGTASRWVYSPTVYWPGDVEEASDYVTFFAYAPYSNCTDDAASACIADCSQAGDSGDPWLLYQLGGLPTATGSEGWKARQIDLLYVFLPDQQRPSSVTDRVSLSFRHALACVGDEIILTCSDDLQDYLKNLSAETGGIVTLTLDQLVLDYYLTAKGLLVLNNATSPNWRAVYSGDGMVHRYLTLVPDQVVATATSSSVCTLTDYQSDSGHGIFYIPLDLSGTPQTLTIRAYYTLSTGDEGVMQTTIDLSAIRQAGEGRNLNLTLDF